MERDLAIALMADFKQLAEQLALIGRRIEAIEPELERRMMRRHVASVSAACDEHLVRPVLRAYPDLDPG